MSTLIQNLKSRLEARSVLALSVRSSALHVNLVNYHQGSSRVSQSFEVPFGADQIAADAVRAGKGLAEKLIAAGIRERRCVVCIPPNWALTASTELPDIGAEEVSDFLELKAEREFPIGVAELRLSHCRYQLADGKQRATVAGVPTKRIETIEKMLEAAGCRLVSLSFGLDRCLTEAPEQSAVHFLANGNHVDLVVTAGGGIAGIRSLATTPTPREPGFDAAGFCRELRITLGRLPEPVRQGVQSARFSGTQSSAESLCAKTRDQLGRMGIEGEVASSVVANDHGEGAAIEAAERHLRSQPVAFEFIPREINRWQATLQKFDSKGRRGMVIGGVCLLLTIGLSFFVRSHYESSLESEWEKMRRGVGELETLQQRIRQFRPWFEPAPQTLDAYESLASAFPDQGEVWAKSIQITEDTKVVFTGFARNQAALMSLLERLRARKDVSGLQVQQVRGENPVQFSVTYKREVIHGN